MTRQSHDSPIQRIRECALHGVGRIAHAKKIPPGYGLISGVSGADKCQSKVITSSVMAPMTDWA